MIARYFDNAATTPLDPRVLQEMLPFLQDGFGNAHSIHGFGRRAEAAVEQARQRVAALLGAEDPSQIVFTSGATESNNWVLSAYPNGCISPYEHSSVLEPAKRLGMTILKPKALTFEHLAEPLDLVSVMAVNNETGTRWDVRCWADSGARTHMDATQALGKVPIDIEGVDFISFSAHKLYGPKGIGGLYYQSNPPTPMILGGEQELGLRGGTLNVPAIVGFGAAAAIAEQETEENAQVARELRAVILDRLHPLSDWQVNGGPNASPFILSLSFAGVQGETLVVEADRAGFAISSGAACSSRSNEPSHVLTAFGLEAVWVKGTVRISFGRFNDVESVSDLGQTLVHSVQKLRTMT